MPTGSATSGIDPGRQQLTLAASLTPPATHSPAGRRGCCVFWSVLPAGRCHAASLFDARTAVTYTGMRSPIQLGVMCDLGCHGASSKPRL